ncbi:hypothetical protein ASG43_01745 [Aureimonas sp. Leaf454]|uniref:lysozyme inhibitor LprI family protein n=1 Tax=Aureimonas sp. Leaf454 TaxID=1736381 RepID=UPI0006F38137|nr:lysozyme inhibitor LprI family protein [Aureimonas sp. Leaf454]KQT54357.1 hypothetical protein ASG43_01745 [Aureimonas sp. Leaf454]
MRRWIVLASLLVLTGPATAAGFDCAKASTPDETAVCADPRLSDLDARLSTSYAAARKAAAFDDVQTVARDFLADRRACGADRACILATYVGVLDSLAQRSGPVARPADITATTIAGGKAADTGALPETIGQCVATRVDSVHSRLEGGDFDAGTGIEYRNGGYQVSYDREEALIASKPGDRVTMCLVGIPRRCPEGDDRGRTYLVTNERTEDTWLLADSQHMCGGA